jgi:hypothetical protein
MSLLYYISPIIAAVLLALLEAYRIKRNMGGPNISKTWTVFYGGLGYCACLITSLNYYDEFPVYNAVWYLGYYVGVRGIVYTTSLNLFRGKKFNYFSKTTNSRIDKFFGSYWKVIAASAGLILITLWIQQHFAK